MMILLELSKWVRVKIGLVSNKVHVTRLVEPIIYNNYIIIHGTNEINSIKAIFKLQVNI